MTSDHTTGSRPRAARTRRLGFCGAAAAGLLLTAACGSTAPAAAHESTAGSGQQPKLTVQDEIANSGTTSSTWFCGTRKITLGVQDGVGTNAFSKYAMAAVRSEAAKCPNVTVKAAIGRGSLQTSISQINSLVAQGVNALVVIPDFGQAELPALRAATNAGVKVVPWAANPGGTAGRDYVAYVDWSPVAAGKEFASWMATAIHGKGNVVYLGGPAGNPVGLGMLQGFQQVFAKYPGIKLLTGYHDWAVMNWDPAQAQQVMSALLAKYPKIDGVLSEDGPSMVGAMRAFVNANRPMVPFTGLQANEFACAYDSYRAANPDLQIASIKQRIWMGRIAARKAIAAAEGIADNEPSVIKQPLFENSLTGPKPQCDKSAPPDSLFGTKISASVLNKYGTVS